MSSIPKIPDGPDTRHAVVASAPASGRRLTPPPWASSDRALANEAANDDCRDKLRRLVLDLHTMAADWDRASLSGVVPHHLLHCADALRSVLRRHGVMP